jgi:GTP-binding protein EngB required for normal cell division
VSAPSGINECYLFFGVSGAGKSSTVNQICGEKKCTEGDGEASETRNCKLVRVENKVSIFHGKSLLDMQGYNDTRPEENQKKLFEMTKLYFVGSGIRIVKCIIFVVNMSDTKTDFYLRFIGFLKQLFSEEQVTKNMIVLLTNGDRLSKDAKEKKLANIKKNIIDIEEKKGYSMGIVEWSNVEPLPNQEKNLLFAISKLPGFDPGEVLQGEAKKIEDEVEKRYEEEDNITIINHAAKTELQEFKIDRVVEDIVPLQWDEVEERIIPAQKETRHVEFHKMVHFQGAFINESQGIDGALSRGFIRIGGVLGSNYVVTAIQGRQERITIRW